ncbi:TIGR00730 family Rossman fold protein [uncultured Jatrophihabitans sp.]|uniref:LOG family protein n=1 Tax=uncultured Jatrophihabitans sp. TaxID=1610747 RepID=UPI0035CB7327
MNICVYCASSEAIEVDHLDLATAVGERIAADGHGLVSGGGRVSMMGAVARAARAGGAHTTGVIPAHLVPFEVADTDADELLVVETMRERKRLMDERSDAFLALPGGIGTLEELFEIWTANTLGMHAKPVVVLDPAGFYEPLWGFLDGLREQGFVRAAALAQLHRTTTVDAAFAALTSPPALR